MTAERLAEIRAMTTVEVWQGDTQRLAAIADLLVALDAAEKVCRSLDHVLDGRHWPGVWAALVAWRELAP